MLSPPDACSHPTKLAPHHRERHNPRVPTAGARPRRRRCSRGRYGKIRRHRQERSGQDTAPLHAPHLYPPPASPRPHSHRVAPVCRPHLSAVGARTPPTGALQHRCAPSFLCYMYPPSPPAAAPLRETGRRAKAAEGGGGPQSTLPGLLGRGLRTPRGGCSMRDSDAPDDELPASGASHPSCSL